ncbi:MAG: class I SAM-dependent methyltransferase [Pseudomonadota bacterium]
MYDDMARQSNVSRNQLIEQGLKAAGSPLRDQVKTWERYTDEKANVARDLMRSVKAQLQDVSCAHGFRTLSIGSSDEPQFPLLHALSDGGLWLYDCDDSALAVVKERADRLLLNDVHTVSGSYLDDFKDKHSASTALQTRLGDARFDLITLHHALYYCAPDLWPDLMNALCSELLKTPGLVHLALMSSATEQTHTTTWLYNRFAEKFCNTRNDQNLLDLPGQMSTLPIADTLAFSVCSSAVRCRPDRFADMMKVVWMILLYPQVHDFSADQKVEITEFVLDEFWLAGRDLVQHQDYVTLTKSR